MNDIDTRKLISSSESSGGSEQGASRGVDEAGKIISWGVALSEVGQVVITQSDLDPFPAKKTIFIGLRLQSN